jgi:hypothetical protein
MCFIFFHFYTIFGIVASFVYYQYCSRQEPIQQSIVKYLTKFPKTQFDVHFFNFFIFNKGEDIN